MHGDRLRLMMNIFMGKPPRCCRRAKRADCVADEVGIERGGLRITLKNIRVEQIEK